MVHLLRHFFRQFWAIFQKDRFFLFLTSAILDVLLLRSKKGTYSEFNGRILDRKDQNRQIRQGFPWMVRPMIGQVKVGAEQVASGSRALTDSSTLVSNGANDQAAAAEEAASSVEELTSSIRHSTENAMKTESAAVEADRLAEQGSSALGETITSLKLIAERILIVEEIARQTNLLALNARGARQGLCRGGGGSSQAGRVEPGSCRRDQ